MRLRGLVVAAILLLAPGSHLHADQDAGGEDQEASPGPPEPQTAPRLVIRGFGNTDYRYRNDSTPNTFALGQLDIFMTSELSDSLSVLAEVVFEAGENAGTIIDVERYQIKYSASDWLNILLGRMHTPLGHWNQTYHHGTWFQTTAQRPEVYRFEDEGGILPIHEVGLQVQGKRPLHGLQLDYSLSLTNGRGHHREEIAGTQDHNSSKALNLWIGLRPRGVSGLQVGGVARFDTIPSGPSAAGRRGELGEDILGGFATYQHAGIEALAEVIQVKHEDQAAGARYFTTGYYLQGAYAVGRIKPYYRFDSLEVADRDPFYEPETADIRKHTIGLRADPWTWAALKLELSLDDPKPGKSAKGVSFQAAFTF